MIALRGRHVRQRKLYRNDLVLHLLYNVVVLRIKPHQIRNWKFKFGMRNLWFLYRCETCGFYTNEQQISRANVHA